MRGYAFAPSGICRWLFGFWAVGGRETSGIARVTLVAGALSSGLVLTGAWSPLLELQAWAVHPGTIIGHFLLTRVRKVAALLRRHGKRPLYALS